MKMESKLKGHVADLIKIESKKERIKIENGF